MSQNLLLKKICSLKDAEASDNLLLELAAMQVLDNQELVRPWVTVGPLFLECQAIETFTHRNQEYRGLLPKVSSIHMAVSIADGDYRLAPDQELLLIESLVRPLPNSLPSLPYKSSFCGYGDQC